MKVLWVPTIGLDIPLLDRLAASVDHHIEYKVIWNNGLLGALDKFESQHPDWIVKNSGLGNIGCAGAWNMASKVFPEEPAILIANEDCYFLPGYLEKICQCADANPDAPLIHLNDSHAYYCFCATESGRSRFGPFDENFWPVYYEDCDMRVRHRLAGVYTYPYALQGLEPLPHGKPRTGGDNYAALVNGAGLLNRAYWLRKWGSFNFEKAHYPFPYNDQRLTFKDWVWYPEERAIRHPLWNTFINLPEPSIYT